MQQPLAQPIEIAPNLAGAPLQQNAGGESILTMASRSNFESPEQKTYNIERPIIQPIRGVILRLLGMSNIGEADDMGVWVKTTSNNPPIFESKNNAEKILSLCKDAGAELQEEAKAGAREMITFMWSQLQKELLKRTDQLGKPLMTKGDIENVVNDIFKTVRLVVCQLSLFTLIIHFNS